MEILLFVILLLTVAAAQAPTTPKEVPVAEEPSHHLVLENQYTRTYQVEVGPGRATLLHRHDHDYVFVALGDADISNEVLDKPPLEQELKNGDVKFASGGFAHVARNLASTPFRNVTIEVLRKSKVFAPVPGCGGQIGGLILTRECTIVDSDAVKVLTEWIMPRMGFSAHRQDRGYLLVATSDLHLKNNFAKGPSDIQQKAGDVLWVEAGGEQTLTNVGTQPARFVIVEFR